MACNYAVHCRNYYILYYYYYYYYYYYCLLVVVLVVASVVVIVLDHSNAQTSLSRQNIESCPQFLLLLLGKKWVLRLV